MEIHQLTPINFSDVDFVKIGHDSNEEGKTGVTAIYLPYFAIAGIDISGGGPASRETPLADPLTSNTPINAILLSGGSAFGLEASIGAVKFLEEKNIGVPTGWANVPIVLQSCIFDLCYGSSKIRPDVNMGYNAMKNAFEGVCQVNSGNFGGGLGATVGKLFGMKRAMKSGIGFSAFKLDDFIVCAIVVVNALGDVYKKDNKIAGMKTEDRKKFVNFMDEVIKGGAHSGYFGFKDSPSTTNTTIGAIIMNGEFSKGEMTIIANKTRSAYSRCIRPVGTMMDGDTIYAVSTGKERIKMDINIAGMMSEYAMEEAIINSIEKSQVSEEEYLKNALNLGE